jgi:hypothetical protein
MLAVFTCLQTNTIQLIRVEKFLQRIRMVQSRCGFVLLLSKFTRVQRLTVALCLLMTTMLSSLMFFGVPSEDPFDQVSVRILFTAANNQ